MSFKDIITDPASWLTTILALMGGAFGYKKIFAESKGIDADTDAKGFNLQVKKDRYKDQQLENLATKLQIEIEKNRVMSEALQTFQEEARKNKIIMEELLAELNLYKTISAGHDKH